MSEGRYVGITIGPIYDTLLEASSPAAMWFASSIFSDMTRRLCNEIYDNILSDNHDNQYVGRMYSPYYDREEATKEGAVGKYHDRIIFYTTMPEDELLNRMKGITSKVKKEIGQIVYGSGKKEDEFFQSYLQVHYVLMDASEVKENIIKAISPYLDEMELMRTYPKASESNPFRTLFEGKENGSNRLVKESDFFQRHGAAKNLGENEQKLSSIETIANCGETETGKKKKKYYAFVAADGDSMGKTLEKLVQNPSDTEDKKLENFSRACLEYTEQAAKLVSDFGGMTIYAGGDDLLFLAPVENKDGQSIFKLCYDVQKCFRETINKRINLSDREKAKETETIEALKIGVPTLSFGIAIQYYKFPLYEALAKARSLLDKAKNTTGIRKDSMAVQLTKHSGQTILFEVSNAERSLVEAFIEKLYNDEKTINSIIFAINVYRPVFEELQNLAQQEKIDQKTFTGAWLKVFDNINQVQYSSYVESIADNYYQYLIKGIRGAFDKWDQLLCDTKINESEFKKEWEKIANHSDVVKQYLNDRCFVPNNGSAEVQWNLEYLKYLNKWKGKDENSHQETTESRLHLLEALLRYKRFLSEEGID